MGAVTYPQVEVVEFVEQNLIPLLMTGIGKCYFDRQQFDKAISTLEKLLAQYPKSDAAPEAVYLLGVARDKSTHDPKPLKQAYEQLSSQYPTSEWTKRASP